MSNSKSQFPFSSLMLTSLLFLVLSVSTFHFSGCAPETDTKLGHRCKVTDFQVTPDPDHFSIAPGSSEMIEIIAEIMSECYDIAKWFKVEITGNNPAGITLTGFNSVPMDADYGFRTGDISVPQGTPAGSYQIEILTTATLEDDRTAVDTKTLFVDVTATPDFSLSLPESFGVAQTKSITVTANISRTGDHSENINLTIDNFPANATYSFDPNPVQGGVNSSLLTVSADFSAIPDEYSLLAKGNDGTLERHDLFTLFLIEPFHLSFLQSTISIVQGQSGSLDIYMNRMGGYPDSIDLVAEGGIIGQGANFVEVTIDPNPSYNSISSTVTLLVGNSVTAGTYDITFKGTVGQLEKSVILHLTVIE